MSSTGASALEAKIVEKGLTSYALAKQLGVGLSVVSRWLHGQRTPSLPAALALQELLGLPVTVWAQPLARKRGKARAKAPAAEVAA